MSKQTGLDTLVSKDFPIYVRIIDSMIVYCLLNIFVKGSELFYIIFVFVFIDAVSLKLPTITQSMFCF